MSAIFVDRRKNNSGKSVGKRNKFLKRVQDTIKEQIPDIINGRKIKDIDSEGGRVRISRKTISEPSFRNGHGGIRDIIVPGNDQYEPGDNIDRPKGGGGKGGKQASADGESEDDFIIELNREEFLDLLFQDMELPNMVKQNLSYTVTPVQRRAGYVSDGAPCKLSVVRSLKQAKMRKISSSAATQRQLEEAIARRDELLLLTTPSEDETNELAELEVVINRLTARHVRFIDETDLRYHNSVNEYKPTTHAVMIMLQDVSGSMGEREKMIARKSCWLLYMFLRRKYDTIELRFAIHTTSAKEVEEEEFFGTRESGGTIVSSGLKVVDQIVDDYPDTNIYVYQASDGDNHESDNVDAIKLMQRILPRVQYYAYTQIQNEDDPEPRMSVGANLWSAYKRIDNKRLAMRVINHERDIYQVFHDLFQAN